MTEHVSNGGSSTRVEEVEWGSQRPPTAAIVEAIAEATDQDPLDIDPVQNHVDTDALEKLVTSDTTHGDVEVHFEYEAFTVRVEGSGTVEVHATGLGE
ncbi:HalOD1 output domain-containing protein [Halobacterium bonnevillei]|uniref:Halobacterial output domain-containing protein n=1 Tax=Halobacterium bonnevillei TaxID=2692200 RepID=A0A6B0SF12_9EURY|nr:HalOD1 output domain-containing protein [Halobacterium bonnevillei]MXR20344.1 hypothetical protein [Halobacterium bonnevillei]